MNESKSNQRTAYRTQMRVDLRKPGFWLFSVSIYAFTFLAVALLMFAGALVGEWFFHVDEGTGEPPLVTAFRWANLIEAIYLIAVVVLYLWGGPSGIPFLASKKNEQDKA